LAQKRATTIEEFDPRNAKLCHRLDAKSITDDDLLFLHQIGLQWVRLEIGEGDTTFEDLRTAQQRFARLGMRIYSGVHYSYRSVKVQLGLPGRDKDIETYCRFLRDLGKLEIPIASYDFHPANTYTTKMVEHRGYTAREFDLDDFRNRVEKRQFDREYSADDIWANYTYFLKAVLPVAWPSCSPITTATGVPKRSPAIARTGVSRSAWARGRRAAIAWARMSSK
jgi:D-mannonate dehydratase